MARASDFAAIGDGLDSIRQSILQRKLEEYRAQKDAEEKARYEAQSARQIKLDDAMGQFRTSQLKNQTDAAADAAAARKFTQDRLTAADALKAQGAAQALDTKRQYMSQFGPAVAADPETNPTPNGEATGGLDITSPEDQLRAAQRVPGALDQDKMLSIATSLANTKARLEAGGPAEAKNIEPQLKTFTIGGKDVTLIYNPATGHHSFPPDSKTNKPNMRDVLAVGKQIKENTARMAEILSMDPAQVKRGVTDKEYRALEAENRKLNDMMFPLMDEKPAASPGVAAAPGAAPAPAAAPAAAQPTAPRGAAAPKVSSPVDAQEALRQANEAISQGKDPALVRKRLLEMGIQLKD